MATSDQSAVWTESDQDAAAEALLALWPDNHPLDAEETGEDVYNAAGAVLRAVTYRLQQSQPTATEHLHDVAAWAAGLEAKLDAVLRAVGKAQSSAGEQAEWISADYDAAERALRTLGMSSVMHRSQLREFAVAALDAVAHRLQPQPAASEPERTLLQLTARDWDGIAEATARHSGAGSWTGGNSYYWGVRNWLKEQRGVDDTWETRQERRAAGHEREDAAYVETALKQAGEPPALSRETVADLCSYDDEPSEMATPEESTRRAAAAREFLAHPQPAASEPERAKAFGMTAEEEDAWETKALDTNSHDVWLMRQALGRAKAILAPSERERELVAQLQWMTSSRDGHAEALSHEKAETKRLCGELAAAKERIKELEGSEPADDKLTAVNREYVESVRKDYSGHFAVAGLLEIVDELAPKTVPKSALEELLQEMRRDAAEDCLSPNVASYVQTLEAIVKADQEKKNA